MQKGLIPKPFWLVLVTGALYACGGGGGSSGGSQPPAEPYTGILSGTLVAPNGTTPISDATLYLEENGARAAVVARAASNSNCPAPANSSEFTCSGADGQFSFEVTDLPPGTRLHAEKGAWSLTYTISLRGPNPGELGQVAFDTDTAAGAARIAVVTGPYDRIEDLLAKMGLGEISNDAGLAARSAALAHSRHQHAHSHVPRSSLLASTPNFEACMDIQDPIEMCACLEPELGFNPCEGGGGGGGGLVLGTETFDLYDGYGSLPDDQYPKAAALFENHNGQPRLFGYDILYVNCGAFEPEGSNWQDLLQQFVANGGVLFATDWGSDWVAAFSDVVAPALTNGEDVDSLLATVTNSPLADWLDNVTCANGACITGNQQIGLSGFMSGWHLLKPLNASNVNPLVRANVSALGFPGETNAIMTFQFNHGDGQVIYSSYHTEPSHAFSTDYLPQERVLEYLFFAQTP